LGKLDEAKEYIGALKTYLGFIVALGIAIGAGISKLYLDNKIDILFYIGVTTIILLAIAFIIIVKHLHKKIKKLEDID
jgi:uncharacterized membrane protein AbrB (regulator of aidB expression)